MEKVHDYCIILAGGIGKRLWPCSRKQLPKQFIDFFGTGRTLLQQTFDRVARVVPTENIFVSTYTDYLPLVREQLPAVSPDRIMPEPVQLSTAPTVAWAASHIVRLDAAACIFVTPCDQVILHEERYAEELQQGLDYVRHHDVFLAMGVPATRANSAYGYLQLGDELEAGLYSVRSFTEKPDEQYAQFFVDSGEFVWNTGLILANAATISKVAPAVNLENYSASTRRSIDLAILEGRDDVCVHVCRFGWADIGSWPELHNVGEKDADGNVVLGKNKTLLTGSSNNLVSVPDKMAVILRGLDGYLVAANDRVLLICPNNDPGLVKKIYKEASIELGEQYT